MAHVPHIRDARLIAYCCFLAMSRDHITFWDERTLVLVADALTDRYAPYLPLNGWPDIVREVRDAVADDLALPPWVG